MVTVCHSCCVRAPATAATLSNRLCPAGAASHYREDLCRPSPTPSSSLHTHPTHQTVTLYSPSLLSGLRGRGSHTGTWDQRVGPLHVRSLRPLDSWQCWKPRGSPEEWDLFLEIWLFCPKKSVL